MLLSVEQTFSDAQALTLTGAASTNLIDLGATGTVLGAPAPLIRDIGKGKPIPIIVRMDVAAGGTAPTIQVNVEIDTAATFPSATIIASSLVVAAATAGQEIWLDVYLPEGANQRFIRLDYITGGTTPTHTVTAAIVAAKQSSTVPGA